MNDTPRTDAAECRLHYYETRGGNRYAEVLTYIEPETARHLELELAAVTTERDALQARLDTLMLEFCPEEMTVEQRVRWESAQARVKPDPKPQPVDNDLLHDWSREQSGFDTLPDDYETGDH